MQDAVQWDKLKSGIRGNLILQGDKDYDAARRVFNGMIDKHPRAIVRCEDAADVAAAVDFARAEKMPLAVRGGGHSGAGLASCDDGLVIDLSRMNGVRFDPVANAARVEGGATWGKVDHATHRFGRTVPSGIISSTGVGGLTLGGGHGYLARKYGLTIDHLLEVDVVLADGRLVTTNAGHNEDLFWAVRGGGGNFGVVTSFLFKTQPVHTVHGGVTFWGPEEAGDVLRWYREFLPAASEDLYGFFAFLKVPPAPHFPSELHYKPMRGIVWSYAGEASGAEDAFRPVRDFGPPAFTLLGPMPFPALQTMFDPLYPPGLQWYWKGDFFREISDEAIVQNLKYGLQLPSQLSTAHFYPVDGAVNRIGAKETAFSYRDAKWSMIIAGIDPEPANKDRITSWVKEYWTALHPWSAGGAYVNFMMDEGVDRVRATYGGNYERLAAVKGKYDPGNLFHVNQNIKPGQVK